MRLLSARSTRAKLSLLTCVVALAAVSTAGLGFAGLGFHQLCVSESQQLRNHAQLLGYYGASIMKLGHRTEGERLLASLSNNPSIEAACLFDFDQNCISRYGNAKSMAFPFHLQGKPYRLASLNRLETLVQVDAAGQPIGFVYLRSNTNAAQAGMGQFLRGAGVVSLVALGVCWVVAFPLKRSIAKPIGQLAKAVEEMVSGDTPAINLAGRLGPECARVLDAVNKLIVKTTASAHAAELATSGLEDRVAESNHGLAQELKRLHKRHDALERAKEAADAASLAKSSFIADLGQEMSEPLDRIVDGLEALLGSDRPLAGHEAASQLEDIFRHGQQLQQLVQGVSEIARVEAGRVKLEQVDCTPETIIADVVTQYQDQADAKGIGLEYRWRGSVGVAICCDPERLRQVVQVLVANAIRFTEVGGVRVCARFEQGSEARQLRIEVTDTGIGIGDDKIDQIFEPSSRSARVQQDDVEAAMGLRNCRKIVNAMGGQITVNSSVGEGSAFTVTLNAGAASNSTSHVSSGEHGDRLATPRSARGAAASVPTGSDRSEAVPPRILVVDDSDTNRDLTQLVLRRAGARVEGAENGLEAVQAAIGEPFDLVFMDMQMPVMDGYSATREIRAQGLDVPIIALTAHALEFDEMKCLAVGCNGHLNKPATAEDLLAAADRFLPPHKRLARAAAPAAKPAPQAPPQAVVKPRSPYEIDFEPQPTATVS